MDAEGGDGSMLILFLLSGEDVGAFGYTHRDSVLVACRHDHDLATYPDQIVGKLSRGVRIKRER